MLNSMSSPLIDLNRVTKAYKTDAGLFMALKGIDLHINAGEFVAIIGKSGSGKTTLINMITGLDRPTSGEILVGGAAVEKLGENQLAIWRGGYCSAWGSKTNTIDTGMEAKPPA